MEWLPLLMFAVVFLMILSGYAVAPTLAGVALIFALVGAATGVFQLADLGFMPIRIFGVMSNTVLIALPLFILMGVTLERTNIANKLLQSLSILMARTPGGLAIAVVLVGALMAASTGIVGATVVTLGLLALPVMLKQNYRPSFATGTIAATGTLGQIIPPSIALVLLGDVLSNAYQQAQLSIGVFNPKTVSVEDLFIGSLLPGLVLVALYASYIFVRSQIDKTAAPPAVRSEEELKLGELLTSLVPPILLIVVVLGSILAGYATPTEAAGVGACGALLMALLQRALSIETLKEICRSTLTTTAMVFFILIGASVFSLVFRGYGGDELVSGWFAHIEHAPLLAVGIVMLVIFLLGFVLDFVEITYIVVPIVGPVLLAMGIDPVWLGVLIAINLQTSFLTPPFGFALFYLRGVTPPTVETVAIYKGVAPFIVLQLILIGVLVLFPTLATWLPSL
ncbi:MAG: TRAP transporter large permease subunit [Gammaproteobacteria bacterium]|nr:TRAP transporter large permease subunit [Gammaproteobacteria bacterium]